MSDSYFAKIILTLIGAACGFAAIAGGYYTTYLLVTYLGA